MNVLHDNKQKVNLVYSPERIMSDRGRWFRLYDDLVDDAKVQRLSADTFRGLINLWCLASKNDGKIPSVDEVAFRLRLSPKKAESLLATLNAANLIDMVDGSLSPHNWESRQYKSDTSTERVKRFRERSKKQECNVSSDVSETPPDTESETDTETDTPHTPLAGRSVEVKESKPKKPSSIDYYQRPYSADFERFMQAFPARVPTHDKREAWKSYQIALESGADIEVLNSAAGKYGAEQRAAGKIKTSYVKMASTWLNQHCWDNYTPAPASGDAVKDPFPGKFFAASGSPQFEAWTAYRFKTERKSRLEREWPVLIDGKIVKKIGWYFDSVWPPDHVEEKQETQVEQEAA